MQQKFDSVECAVSVPWLKAIIEATEKILVEKEHTQDDLRHRSSETGTLCSNRSREKIVKSKANHLESLANLNGKLCALDWAQGFSNLVNHMNFPDDDGEAQVNTCFQIGLLVSRFIHMTNDRQSIEKACTVYRIFYKCVQSKVCKKFRLQLQRSDFPSYPAYNQIINHLRAPNVVQPLQGSIIKYGEFLIKLEILNILVYSHPCNEDDNTTQSPHILIIDEICRILYNRIEYHFITNRSSDTSGNIRFLPELLINYIHETLNLPSLCELVQVWIPSLATRMIQEIVSELDLNSSSSFITLESFSCGKVTNYFLERISFIIKHVLFQRRFFHDVCKHPYELRDDLLRNAIEKIISFDNLMVSFSQPVDEKYIPCLFNDLIVRNKYIFDWWIEYELRLGFSKIHTLPPTATGTCSQYSNDLYLILPQEMEFFLSIASSLFLKADMISIDNSQREFLARTLIPICVEYIEILHDKASGLRSLLLRRNTSKLQFPTNDFSDIIEQWMEAIGSVHAGFLRFQFYLRGYDMRLCFHDIQKITGSLEKLRDGMIYDVSQCFSENILMERTKLASFLIRCVHTLSLSNVDEFASISSDLSEAMHFLTAFVNASYCKRRVRFEDMSDLTEIGEFLDFSGKAVLLAVASSLENKFIQALRDAHESVSEVYFTGILEFNKDIDSIVSLFPREIMISFRRLENWMKLLIMEPRKYANLRSAVLQLLSDIDETFDSSYDSLVIDQVQAMLHAQGLDVAFDDAVQILTKRLK